MLVVDEGRQDGSRRVQEQYGVLPEYSPDRPGRDGGSRPYGGIGDGFRKGYAPDVPRDDQRRGEQNDGVTEEQRRRRPRKEHTRDERPYGEADVITPVNQREGLFPTIGRRYVGHDSVDDRPGTVERPHRERYDEGRDRVEADDAADDIGDRGYRLQGPEHARPVEGVSELAADHEA
jgi:hypothetical protein